MIVLERLNAIAATAVVIFVVAVTAIPASQAPDRGRLLEARRDVGFWCRYVLTREFPDRAGWELQNLLTIARLMIEGALARDESRGTHFRSDFPTRDDARWGLRHVASPAA